MSTASAASFAEALEHRRADIALGPSPGTAATIAAAPFLRCRLILVAAPSHPLAGVRAIAPASLSDERWLVGQPSLDPSEAHGALLRPPRTGPRVGGDLLERRGGDRRRRRG